MGISHFTTPPHTPEQNGVAEHRHRHIVETGLSLLHYAKLPLTFWSHAFQTAVYLINRLPTPILKSQSPFQVLHGHSPSYAKLKPFGCLCYPWLRPYSTSKLQSRSSRYIFLGYSSSKSAYKCLDLHTHKLFHSRHVQFVDDSFPYSSSTTSSLPSPDTFLTSPSSSNLYSDPSPPPLPTFQPFHTPLITPTTSTPPPASTPSSGPTSETLHTQNISPFADPTAPIDPPSTPTALTQPAVSSPPIITYNRRPKSNVNTHSEPSTRQRKLNPKYYNDKFVNHTTLHPIPVPLEPSTPSQALKDPNWRNAMEAEFNALLHNGTWELVPPSTHKPIGCKWIFRIKRNPDGSIEKYKARLVAKGFLQE